MTLPTAASYESLKREGRPFTEDWTHHNHSTVVFQPARMTPRELAEGHHRVRLRFYRLGSILQRLPHHLRHPVFHLAIYVAMRFSRRRAEFPLAPGGEEHGAFVPPADEPD